MHCACGSGVPEAVCCARWIATGAAPTAQALMRSRYTAYVRGEVAYLVATQDESTRANVDVAAVEQWSRETEWRGLEILEVVRGEEDDDEGIVEFIARGVTRGRPFAQRERSRFRRVDGRWYYIDGVVTTSPKRAKNRDR
ncbi:MAG: YchJ family metal-binding protein [Kofleriaceae bacterium]|nr:YchJ family metal-binding protein [Kofleriaceae bacterium]